MKKAFSVVFSIKAQQHLEELADYLFIQTQSTEFVIKHLNQLETYLRHILTLFPEAGTPMENYGEGIRRLSYQKYSIFYRVTGQQIEILTFYRNNLP
jgi:plasmid stabilization system protein ParE